MKNLFAGMAMAAMMMTAVTASLAQNAPLNPAQNAPLQKVLGQLDAAAARFASAQADFAWDQYTAVVQSHDIQKGTIAFRRGAKGTAMVAHVLSENGQATPKDVLFKNGQVDLYQPNIKQETILAAGANRQQYESYSTLGFGSSGRDLSANWNVAYQGSDTVNGVDTAKLDLSSKHPSASAMFTHITIWINPANGTSLRQQFFESSGDYRIASYTNIRLNSAPENVFELKIPKGTSVIRK